VTTGDEFAIDALAGFLPLAARDRLAETLTQAEIDTLTHLARTGTGPNSLRLVIGVREPAPRSSKAAQCPERPLAFSVPRFSRHVIRATFSAPHSALATGKTAG